ncbi:MAG: hypothetical protein ACXWNJ_07110 [Vulcanimicrobiaceae bacterium]
MQLTAEEFQRLYQWRQAGAYDALRLLLKRTLRPEEIKGAVRQQWPDADGKTLIEVLLESGPRAVIAILEAQQR